MNDKVRLAIVYLLAAEAVPGDSEMNNIIEALAAAGSTTKALSYIRRCKQETLCLMLSSACASVCRRRAG